MTFLLTNVDSVCKHDSTYLLLWVHRTALVSCARCDPPCPSTQASTHCKVPWKAEVIMCEVLVLIYAWLSACAHSHITQDPCCYSGSMRRRIWVHRADHKLQLALHIRHNISAAADLQEPKSNHWNWKNNCATEDVAITYHTECSSTFTIQTHVLGKALCDQALATIFDEQADSKGIFIQASTGEALLQRKLHVNIETQKSCPATTGTSIPDTRYQRMANAASSWWAAWCSPTAPSWDPHQWGCAHKHEARQCFCQAQQGDPHTGLTQ